MQRFVCLLMALAVLATACAESEPAEDTAAPAPTTSGSATAPESEPEPDPETEPDPEPAGDVPRLFSDPVLVPSAVSPLAATLELITDVPVNLRVVATADDHEMTTPWTAEPSYDHLLPIVGLRADRTYELEIRARHADGEIEWITTEFTTGSLPDSIPELDITIDAERSALGFTVLELNPVQAVLGGDANPIVAVDAEGEIVWYYTSGAAFTGAVSQAPDGTVTAQNHPFGMRQFTIDGRLVRTVGIDETGEAEITELDGGGINVPYHADWIDLGTVHHDVHPLDDGTVLFLASALHEITAEQRAAIGCGPDDTFEWHPFSDVIVHMDDDGTVLRTWDLWDVIDFGEFPGNFLCQRQGIDVSDTARDWTHANSVVLDRERNAVIVSVRHTDQIIAFDFGEELGPQSDVRWIIGADGTIPYDGESFHHTHGVMVADDGDLVFYDNGNFRPGTTLAGGEAEPYSRAVRVEVDDRAEDSADWSARQVWDHVLDDPKTGTPAYAPFVSDADALPNGNVLVTHGGLGGFVDFQHVHILEIVPDGDRDGDIVWELQLGSPDEQITMYRADRWESLYWGPDWES